MRYDAEFDELHVVPRHPLSADTPYSFVIGSGVRDTNGAPLTNSRGETTRWRETFTTAGPDSSGPVPRLAWPRAGERGVPVQLAFVDVEFSLPVATPRATDRLELETETGQAVIGTDPTPCPRGTTSGCLRWHLDADLPGPVRVRARRVQARDAAGRHAVPFASGAWFQVGDVPGAPPRAEDVVVWTAERCVFAQLAATRSSALQLTLGPAAAVTRGIGDLRVGLPWDRIASSRFDTTWRAGVAVEDLEGHVAAAVRPLHSPEPAGDAHVSPALAIVEVLANPRGEEPREEFVELAILPGRRGEPRRFDGLRLADLPWSAVLERLAQGRAAPGDIVPSFEAADGDRVLLVAQAYRGGTAGDVPPAADALVLRLDASLGRGGLRNAGEALSLYRREPLELISSYTPRVPAPEGYSVVRRDPAGCDVAGQFAVHPGTGASPGRVTPGRRRARR
ncbi:MAG: hypothetical protein B7733_16145 [Myxococcales bacterium FL481]|nr:MAG: hypothetical protein B7733_16145 [Myxococcales bacterium FL481]